MPLSLNIVVYAALGANADWLDGLRETARQLGALVHLSEVQAPLRALREAGSGSADDSDWLLIAANAVLPAHAIDRIRRAATSDPAAQVFSALDNVQVELSPLQPAADPVELDPLAVDRGVFAASSRNSAASLYWSPTFSLWRASALRWLLAHPDFDSTRLPDAIAGGLCDQLYVADPGAPLRGAPPAADPRHPAPPSPLAGLRARFTPRADASPLPGMGPYPVVLHILHGWGGGAAGFVRDLALADDQRCHLALIAHGHSSRRCYGERLDLVLVRDGSVLRSFQLGRPIAATSTVHVEYRAALMQVLSAYAVDALIVSSLIGHDLSVLGTRRPTAVVSHDYYPMWPILHEDFGDATRFFDRADLSLHLQRAGEDFPFADRDAQSWLELREAYVAALLEHRPQMVAPSRSVQTNLLRMEPRLAGLSWNLIAHGLRPFGATGETRVTPSEASATASRSPRLRVLVLGRVSAGKGARLLDALTRPVDDGLEYYFLGCGAAGMAFFGRDRVQIEFNYERDALPQKIAQIAPDLALIAATVSETFSYTLSELRALGMPVLATRLGSLAERIEDGVDGFLCAAQMKDLRKHLLALAADRPALQRVRQTLAGQATRSSTAMAADYRALLPLEVADGLRYRLAHRASDAGNLDAALENTLLASRALAAAESKLREQQAELERRADWAQRMERDNIGLRKRGETLQAEIDRLHHEVRVLQDEFDQRTRWALQLDQQRADLDRERGVMLNSLSWKLTRPLRAVSRRVRPPAQKAVFRLRGLLALIARGRNSLKSRGWRDTLARVVARLRTRHRLLARPQIPDVSAGFSAFGLPTSDTPQVSIVIPVYNHFDHTHTCLRSIAAHPGSVPFEVIVVDDCGSDETAERLPLIEGLRTHRNDENLGFIGACNAGLALAHGEFVVFLNNDTAVTPGWLEALVETFAEHADCGLAGAKLVYPDGRLQEAGGIIFSDGSGWNYGRFDDPAHPDYNYLREADYCSGAAIMLRRELLQGFGGFDSLYKPAYYEDTDLAFRVRDAGSKVYYQPAATVVHFEGISSGTDLASGVKRFQVVNQGKFVERWAAALKRQPAPGTDIRVAREHRRRGRVLIIDACTPEPDKDSGSLRMLNVLRLLIEMGWKVSFAAENLLYVDGYTERLQRLGVEVLYAPWIPDPFDWLAANGALLDAVIVSRHYVADRFIPVIREFAPRARLIFDTVDLHYLREEREAELRGDGSARKLAAKTKLAELGTVRRADLTWVVSPIEQQLLRQECPGKAIDVLSNVHSLGGRGKPFAERTDLLFVGGFGHPPNIDAVQWFVAEIWPLIAAALPEVRFHLIGSQMPAEIQQLGGERIIAHGYVEDLTPFLESCRISLAPLRYGAGVKGKVNQAMAHGLPVVATPMAVEGMYLQAGVEALVAAEAAAFAAEVVRLYRDVDLWNTLAQAGVQNVEKHFSFAAAQAALERALPAR